MRALVAFSALAVSSTFVVACHHDEGRRSSADLATPNMVPPKPPEFPTPSAEQTGRRARSEAILRAAGVPVSSGLPVIDGEDTAKMRTKDTVVDRAIALLIAAVKGEGLDQRIVDRIRGDYGADQFFSPKERQFVLDLSPSPRTRADFAWRYECLGVMHWALGFVDKLAPPSTIVDLIYRYDWACVDARIGGKPPPAGVNCEVVVERHRALNWLYGYQGQAWDDVSTDT
jgi:hypothetical protein